MNSQDWFPSGLTGLISLLSTGLSRKSLLQHHNLKASVLQGSGVVKWSCSSCPALCDPMDCSLPSSSIHGIFQAIVLEWVAISFSRESSWSRDRIWVSHIVDRRFTVWATREVRCCNGPKICSLPNLKNLLKCYVTWQKWMQVADEIKVAVHLILK